MYRLPPVQRSAARSALMYLLSQTCIPGVPMMETDDNEMSRMRFIAVCCNPHCTMPQANIETSTRSVTVKAFHVLTVMFGNEVVVLVLQQSNE